LTFIGYVIVPTALFFLGRALSEQNLKDQITTLNAQVLALRTDVLSLSTKQTSHVVAIDTILKDQSAFQKKMEDLNLAVFALKCSAKGGTLSYVSGTQTQVCQIGKFSDQIQPLFP
jgi:hypothetical protein